jgi:mannose-1-phosphate guanylyltransferase
MLYAVIMAGGSGTRFWPASRTGRPKQLLAFGRGRPLVEETLDRLSGLVPPERVLVMTNAEYVDVMRDVMPEVPADNFLGEPAGRDTSACIGLAAVLLLKRDHEAVMAVVPSDHLIRPKEVFCRSLAAAESFVRKRQEALVTFGIEPTGPATGYGYIRRGAALGERDGVPFYTVDRFHEKPDRASAEALLRSGEVFWNSGIFVWRAETILERIREFLPEIHAGLGLLADEAGTGGFDALLGRIYPTLPRISIDYGVLEKAPERAVAGVGYFWDDLGSWRAMERLIEPDESGNRIQGDFAGMDASDLIVSARGGIVAAMGVEGLIIVHTPDATLVCRKDDAEAVKKLVERLPSEYR